MKNEEHQRLDDLEFIVEVRERRRNRQASIQYYVLEGLFWIFYLLKAVVRS